MENSNNFSGISEYIGFQAPEIPSYIILNNFLMNFFKAEEVNIINFNNLCKPIRFDFNDINDRQKTIHAFNMFLDIYTSKDKSRSNKKNYTNMLPLSLTMLMNKKSKTLRNILYNIYMYRKNSNYKTYKDSQDYLKNYLYPENTNGPNSIIKFLYEKSNDKTIENCEREFPQNDNKPPISENMIIELKNRMTYGLNAILLSESFKNFNFYKKYNYLSTFLSITLLSYIIVKLNTKLIESNEFRFDKKVLILCKGSNEATYNSGELHRACVKNYKDLKAKFNDRFMDYYDYCLRDVKNIAILYKSERIKIKINNENYKSFKDFMKKRNLGIGSKKIDSKIKKAFNLEENIEIKLNKDEFIKKFMNTQKNSGSSLNKISSTLQRAGKDCNILFPLSNAKQKYFAMTPEIVEFLVRLYLSIKKIKYGSINLFIKWLEENYYISIEYSETTINYLKSINYPLGSYVFNRNKDEFIKTLDKANCITKLSDSGFVIVLPENKESVNIL